MDLEVLGIYPHHRIAGAPQGNFFSLCDGIEGWLGLGCFQEPIPFKSVISPFAHADL